MKTWLIKMVIGMLVEAITAEQVIAAIDNLKTQMKEKVAATPGVFDDMALSAFLSQEDQIIEMLVMAREMADDYVNRSETDMDNAIWMPVSAKLDQVLVAMKAAA
jgi:hypothetical protein